MLRLNVLLLAADDVQEEGNLALDVIKELNESFAGQAELESISGIQSSDVVPEITELDLVVAIVWTHLSFSNLARTEPAFNLETILRNHEQTTKPDILMYQKTAEVNVSLSQRTELLNKLEQKEVLERFLETWFFENETSLKEAFQSFAEPAAFSKDLKAQLETWLNQRLHDQMPKRLSNRPKLGATYVWRKRLLQSLPDERGYVVTLEAPYGYGKSILAAQYATDLEANNWRVIWTVATQGIRQSIAAALNLNLETPWQVLHSTLWQEETLLILEDLEGTEDLTDLLATIGGIILLASRSTFKQAELLKLKTQKNLVQLGAKQLAFSFEEALELIPEPKAKELWELTLGWSLPLHFAALTNNQPDPRSLIAGIKASLVEKSWAELLFIAALPQLPESAHNAQTLVLVQKGFVQQLESFFRLHPMIAESLLKEHFDSVRIQVLAEASRLPPFLQAQAFETVEHYEELRRLLNEGLLPLKDAEKLLHWHELAPEPIRADRHFLVGFALARLRRTDEAIHHLMQAFKDGAASLELRLEAIGRAIIVLSERARFTEAEDLVGVGLELAQQADDNLRGIYINTTAAIGFHSGDFVQAEEALTKALDLLSDETEKLNASSNLASIRFELYGDIEAVLKRSAKWQKAVLLQLN